MNKRKIGSLAEGRAEVFLLEQGYQIITRNFQTRFGEIDLIVKKDNVIVFVEVRYRKDDSFGSPLESISTKKIKSICKTALLFPGLENQDRRFDVIAITGEKIEHLSNAFEFCF